MRKNKQVRLTKTVAVVRRDNNQSFVQNAEFLQLGDGGADCVVKLEQIAQGAVVIQGVHLLVDRGAL